VNEKTQRVYDFIREYIGTRGHAPTHDEIVAACHISKLDVPTYLSKLAVNGLIEYQSGKPRGIKLK
jgi:SOS-response transcriptional repressor LexA